MCMFNGNFLLIFIDAWTLFSDRAFIEEKEELERKYAQTLTAMEDQFRGEKDRLEEDLTREISEKMEVSKIGLIHVF